MANNNEKLSTSCPNTPNKYNRLIHHTPQHSSRSHSFNEFSSFRTNNKILKTINIFPNYRNLKNALQKSFRKSKDFVKNERKKLPSSLYFMKSSSDNAMSAPKNTNNQRESCTGSQIDLGSLQSINPNVSLSEQLQHVVNICRQLPCSEISSEMVEAERLLLFSSLRRGNQDSTVPHVSSNTVEQQPITYFFIDDMYLPVQFNTTREDLFNYFYIVTFECGGTVRSSQSAECRNGLAVFRNCGIEFIIRSELEGMQNQQFISGNIFMLRLRKVSRVSSEHDEVVSINNIAVFFSLVMLP